MREIKFRGKNIENGEWVYGSYVHFNNPELEDFYQIISANGHEFDIIPETVGQYTGQKGLNGAGEEIDIYEGDIFFEYPGKYWKVYFDEGMFMIDCKQTEFAKSLIDGLSCVDGNSLTHIGNEFENPELLK